MQRTVESRGAFRDGVFQRRQVLRRAFDHLGQPALLLGEAFQEPRHLLRNFRLRLVHLLGGFVGAGDQKLGELRSALGQCLVDRAAGIGDIASNLRADAPQRFTDPLTVVRQRIPFGRQLVDQVPDTKLVFAVRALERGDLVVHHCFEFGSPADGTRDGVVHRRDLAANGLSDGGHRLLGQLVGLGESNSHFGHGGCHQAQLLGAPNQQSEEPENDDRNDDRGRGRKGRGAQKAAAGGLVGDDAVGEKAADDEPNGRCGERDQKRRARGPLLQSENQAADRRNVVVGGRGEPALRRWARGPARPGQVLGRRGPAGRFRHFGRFGVVLRCPEARGLFARGVFAPWFFPFALLRFQAIGER